MYRLKPFSEVTMLEQDEYSNSNSKIFFHLSLIRAASAGEQELAMIMFGRFYIFFYPQVLGYTLLTIGVRRNLMARPCSLWVSKLLNIALYSM